MIEVKWTPFEIVKPTGTPDFEGLAAGLGVSPDAVREAYEKHFAEETVFRNSRYQVHVVREKNLIWLSIKRIDKQPIRDWRDMQRIKNELVGPEHEGVELFPAESRLVDTANQYHMWVLPDAKTRFPFGFDSGRHFTEKSGGGAVQRKMEA